MTKKCTIGTRGSDLALWQANYVKKELERLIPDCAFEIKIIKTTGDEVLKVSLSKIGDKGLFTRQIEAELLAGTIDIAVHSLKDVQTTQPDGLVIGAVGKRETPNRRFCFQAQKNDRRSVAWCGRCDWQPETPKPTPSLPAGPQDRGDTR